MNTQDLINKRTEIVKIINSELSEFKGKPIDIELIESAHKKLKEKCLKEAIGFIVIESIFGRII